MILNQEADELIYSVAHSCQTKCYLFKSLTNDRTMDLGAISISEIKKYYSEKNIVYGVDYTLEEYIVPKDSTLVEQKFSEIMDYLAVYAKTIRLFLSPADGSNFRYSVAKTSGPRGQGYKAGRPPKPYYYTLAREILIDKYGAVQCHGYEADDALAMYQTKHTIASHQDKDIDMVYGKHLNWTSGKLYTIDHDFLEMKEKISESGKKSYKLIGGGELFFFSQLLTGDHTDNILGIHGLGIKKAYSLLAEEKDSNYTKNRSINFSIIVEKYQKAYGEEWKNILCEMADLLWMVRRDRLTGSQWLIKEGLLT